MLFSKGESKMSHCHGAGFKFKVGLGKQIVHSVRAKEMFLKWMPSFTIGVNT